MNIPFVDLKAQYLSIKSEIDDAIQNVILDSAFIGGKYIELFERNYASYIGAKHCIGVGNGTDALFIALKSLGVKTGDEVITVANSFVATSEAITASGARVVFADCHEKTYNINIDEINKKITRKTRAIIPVHLYGQPAEMEKIIAIAQKNNLFVVEDAAQAHGAQYQDKAIGTWGDCACFSFFPGKNLGAYGDAGAIVTNNDDLARKARMFANHGRIGKYNHEFEGVNSRLDGLQAAILDVKLKFLKKWTERRQAVAKMYDEGLKDVVGIPHVMPGVSHVFHLYVVRVKNRERVVQYLRGKSVSTGIHYPIPLPFLKAYSYLAYKPEDFPVAGKLKDEILSLPIHGNMKNEEVEYVIQNVRMAVQEEK